MSTSATKLSKMATEVAFAAPQVVMHRMMRMALAGYNPSARDQKEFQQMGMEKFEAFYESWQAMMWQTMQANQRLMMSMWFPTMKSVGQTAKQLEKDTFGILASGMKPVHKRAVSNAKRLGKTRLF